MSERPICPKHGLYMDEHEASTGMCVRCLFDAGEALRQLDPKDRERLRKAVKEELAGLLPREQLRALFEDAYGDLVKGEVDFDDRMGRLVNETERIAGVALCRELLDVLGKLKSAMESSLGEEMEEIREKAKRITSL